MRNMTPVTWKSICTKIDSPVAGLGEREKEIAFNQQFNAILDTTYRTRWDITTLLVHGKNLNLIISRFQLMDVSQCPARKHLAY